MIHALLLIAAVLLATLAVDAGHGYRLGTFIRWVKYRLTPEPRQAEPAPEPEPAEPEVSVHHDPVRIETLLAMLAHYQEAAEFWHDLAERAVAEYLELEKDVARKTERKYDRMVRHVRPEEPIH